MTREEILAMEPGKELDTATGKLFDFAPKIEWCAMNKEETGYFIEFEHQREAERWLEDLHSRGPLNSVYEGAHIVRKEVYPHFSTNIAHAMQVVEKANIFPFSLSRTTLKGYAGMGWQVNWCRQGYDCDNCDTDCPIDEREEVVAKTAPEAIVKAALLVALEL